MQNISPQCCYFTTVQRDAELWPQYHDTLNKLILTGGDVDVSSRAVTDHVEVAEKFGKLLDEDRHDRLHTSATADVIRSEYDGQVMSGCLEHSLCADTLVGLHEQRQHRLWLEMFSSSYDAIAPILSLVGFQGLPQQLASRQCDK